MRIEHLVGPLHRAFGAGLAELFLAEPGRAYSRSDIIDRVWGSGFALSDRTIDSHIKALRKKISDAGGQANYVETVRGIGYRLFDPSERS